MNRPKGAEDDQLWLLTTRPARCCNRQHGMRRKRVTMSYHTRLRHYGGFRQLSVADVN